MTLPGAAHPWEPSATVQNLLFVERTFESLNLVGGRFRRVKFVRCQFVECDFSHASFLDCDIYDCAFVGCVFYFCQLSNCELTKTRFQASYLSGIRIRGCDLTRTQFGSEFPLGDDRKLRETPEGGLPPSVFVSGFGDTMPSLELLEDRWSGIAVANCPWFIQFLGRNDLKREHRRRSVLAAQLANQLLAFGRGDSSRYHYLARLHAGLSERKAWPRIRAVVEKWLWGYGYRTARLLRAGAAGNVGAIVLYLSTIALGWGSLADNQVAVSSFGVESVAQCVYYSVVVATTLGFGDIVPHGACRLVLILQVFMNLVLVAMWLSGLTSPIREWNVPEDLEE